MNNIKSTINIDKVKKCITRIINNSQDMCDKVNKYYDVYRLKNSRYY